MKERIFVFLNDVKSIAINRVKEYYNRLKTSPVLVKSTVAAVWTFIAPYFNLPEWAQVSTIVLALVYVIFGLGNNPTDQDNY